MTEVQPIQRSYRIRHLLMAAYLLLFLGWMVPHHACDHTPKDLHSSSELTTEATGLSSHHPDLCQICKTHGQFDLILVGLQPAAESLPEFAPTSHNSPVPDSCHLSHFSPRSPPFNA